MSEPSERDRAVPETKPQEADEDRVTHAMLHSKRAGLVFLALALGSLLLGWRVMALGFAVFGAFELIGWSPLDYGWNGLRRDLAPRKPNGDDSGS